LRVPQEAETGAGGLDMYEHGIEAYPNQVAPDDVMEELGLTSASVLQ